MAYGLKALIDQRVEGGEALAGPSRRARAPRRPSRRAAAEAPTPPSAEARRAERRSAPRPRRRQPKRPSRDRDPKQQRESEPMATMSTDELLDVFKNMTVLELNDFLKAFEEEFGVTAAAPVAVAAAGGGGGGGDGRGRRGEGRVRRHPRRRRRQEDPGHQGGPRAHQPRPEGGQGPRRRRPEAGAREGVQGRRREGQGEARGGRRHGRAQVAHRPAGAGGICRRKWLPPGGLVVSCADIEAPIRRAPAPAHGVLAAGVARAMLGVAVSARSCLSDLPGSCRRAPECPGASRRCPFVARLGSPARPSA